jgi:peptide deformylase
VQDEISYDKSARRFRRSSNRAGGLEGGITNGEDVLVRGYLKPISTLRRALGTADMVTKEPVQAAYERSDWCVVPAAGVAGEGMVALVLADAFLQKFGGDADLEQLAEDMFASMYAAQGVGLAAPQIGLNLRIAVVDVTGGKNPEAKIVLANPEIIHAEGEKREEEGCLSIPGFRGYVLRPQFVTIKAQNAKGESFEIRGEDLLARAFCHEIDHLNGILFIQHLSMLKRDLIKRKIKKLKKQGEW